ncbi:MAG: protein-disulfide reductase DsbD [Granulosicoccus sp.]|nr:protein-disulfide reductase DsbD [Granulosicoccus sp.]
MQSIAAAKLLLVCSALASPLVFGNLLGGSEPLAPEAAFVASISSIESDRIKLKFTIEPGYYLYRDKLKFQAGVIDQAANSDRSSSLLDSADRTTQSVLPVLSEPRFSEAQIISDQYFGEQAVFRDTAEITLAYSAPSGSAPSGSTPSGSARSFNLEVTFQGCADIGLCYPPTDVILPVKLPQQTTLASSQLISNGSDTTQAGLAALLQSDSSSEELLPPELAYLPQITSATPQSVSVRWHIENGYYLYRDKLSFAVEGIDGARVLGTTISPGTAEHDEFFGTVQVLRNAADASIQLEPVTSTDDATLVINYQGCADIGVCFPPSTARLPLVFTSSNSTQPADTPIISNTVSAAPPTAGVAAQSDRTESSESTLTTLELSDTGTMPAQSEQERLTGLLATNSLWLNVVMFFGLGLLLAFTPCVLPMVPILSSLIVGQGDSISTGKAFRLSLVYVLVMATTYAVVGVFVGMSGYNVQVALQTPWVLTGIALIFVALSMSMFGFYEIRLPHRAQHKLTQWSNRQSGGQYTGVAVMGFISTLIVGPCVTAPLAGTLIYIARTGDAWIGGTALFALGLGMGAPLLLIGTSAGKLLPRAGTWMNKVNHLFGILLLAMAIYMLSRFLPANITMSLYGALAVIGGVYLGATDTLSRDSSGWQRFNKGAGLIVSLYGASLLIAAMSGSGSYTTPLRSFVADNGSASSANNSQHALNFQRIKSLDDLYAVVSQAQGKPVMLDFYADWCISCKEMEAFTFTNSQVQTLLKPAVLVQADVTANDEIDQALLKAFDLFGPPGIIFYDVSGEELPAARVVGFMNAEDFSSHIERFIGSSNSVASRY